MIKKLTLLASLILLGSSINAQVYKGVLINGQNGTPVEFTNVGIVRKNIGTVSNRHGQFELRIPAEHLRDSIRFSMIGYEPVTLLVSDFINRSNDTIFMKEKPYSIRELVIIPTGPRIMILGNSRKGPWAFHSLGSFDNKGMEAGVILDPKNNTVLLKTITLNDVMFEVSDNGRNIGLTTGQDTMLLRINLYHVNSRNEFENILTQPVYIKVDGDNNYYLKKFDISEHNLVIDSKVLLTLEYFDEVFTRTKIRINGTFFGPDSYVRRTSQGSWQKLSGSLGIFVETLTLK